MDKSAITAMAFVVVAAILAVIGVNHGDQVFAELPGGKATGFVGSICLLLTLFIGAYRIIRGFDNKLNDEGFRNLMHMHFDATAHGLLHICDRALQRLENNPSDFNEELFIDNQKRSIYKSREYLSPFCTDGINNIPAYLNSHLQPNDLEELIKHALVILKGAEDVSSRRTMVYDFIQRAQGDLLRKMQISK